MFLGACAQEGRAATASRPTVGSVAHGVARGEPEYH